MLGRAIALVILLTCSLQSGNLPAQDAMQWTNLDGKAIAGEFVRMEGKTVVIRLENGKEAKVPLSSLSLESHLQALKLSKPEAFNKEIVKAPVVVEAAKLPFKFAAASVLNSPFESDPTIDSFMRTLVDEFNRGNYFFYWHTLPPKMQTDLAILISRKIQVTPQLPAQMKKLFTLLASICSKKKDWLLDPSVLGAEIPPEINSYLEPSVPHLVALLEGLAEPSIWDNSFRPETIPNFLAALGVNGQYVAPVMSKFGLTLSYKIISESADRAEVEISFPGSPPQTVAYQKVGKIWIPPDQMNQLRKSVDEQLKLPQESTTALGFAQLLPTVLPVLTKLDSAKSKDEFKKTVDTVKALLSNIPGMPAIPGLSGK